jgi:hypothetical protein
VYDSQFAPVLVVTALPQIPYPGNAVHSEQTDDSRTDGSEDSFFRATIGGYCIWTLLERVP